MKKLSTFVFLFILNIFFSNMLFANSDATFYFESSFDPVRSIDIRKIENVQIYYLSESSHYVNSYHYRNDLSYQDAAKILHKMIYADSKNLPIKSLKKIPVDLLSRKSTISNVIVLHRPNHSNSIEMEGWIKYPNTHIILGIAPDIIESFFKYIKKNKYILKYGTYKIIYVKKKKFR